MKHEFHINGQGRRLLLMPETARDKQMLAVFTDGKPALVLVATSGEHVVIEARDPEPVSEDAKPALSA